MLKTRIMALMAALLIAFVGYAQDEEQEAEQTPQDLLIEAVQDEELRDLKKLLDEGVSADTVTEMGMPVLSYAAFHGYEDIAKALIEAGANVNGTDKPGATPLMYAAQAGHADIVTALLEAGADINAADSSGWTPLMRAVSTAQVETTKALKDAGADLSKTNFFGRTALQMAEVHEEEEIIAVLTGTATEEQS